MVPELEKALHAAWARLDVGAPWFGRHELARVRAMLAAFDGWVRASRADGLRLVAVEHPVQLDLPPDLDGGDPELGGGPRAAAARPRGPPRGRRRGAPCRRGRQDRPHAASARAAAEHAQLAVYQLAAALGAFSELVGAVADPGGARLVYLADRSAAGEAKQPVQPPLDAAELARWHRLVRACADDTAGARFPARAGPDCDRCAVRSSCPSGTSSGRPVTDG